MLCVYLHSKNGKEISLSHLEEIYLKDTSKDYHILKIIRSHVIDPMHNMYLGTAKHVMKTWRESNIIREDKLSVIQEKVDEFKCNLLVTINLS